MSKHNNGQLCFLSVFPIGHRVYHSRDDRKAVIGRGINEEEQKQLRGFCVVAKIGYYTQVGNLMIIKVEKEEGDDERQNI